MLIPMFHCNVAIFPVDKKDYVIGDFSPQKVHRVRLISSPALSSLGLVASFKPPLSVIQQNFLQ